MQHSFLFVGCKVGFENACKAEVLAQCSNLRFSYSRPGFLTFKISEGAADISVLNGLTFVRIAGINLGKFIQSDPPDGTIVETMEKIVAQYGIRHVHCWNRDLGIQDDQQTLEFMKNQPAAPPECLSGLAAINPKLKWNQLARPNDKVLDWIEIAPGEFWFGYHQVASPQQSWPGGIIRFSIPEQMISRAFLKTREAMLWSRFPFQAGDQCIELGCSPGGSSLALLESGLQVLGIDPADVDPYIASHPQFTHLKKRGADVRKKQLGKSKWLFADSNVAPTYTLDMAEEMATSQHLHLKGMLLTLKLLKADMTDQLENYRQRVRKMGFQYVRTRQLAFHRNEVCLLALKRKSILRFGKQSKPTTGRDSTSVDSGIEKS